MSTDPHILNLYEAYDIYISDLVSISSRALFGHLERAVEKVDGQNLTFTVNGSGHVRFIGKGCPVWTMDRGGLSIDETYQHFAGKPLVATTFKEALEAIQQVVDQHSAHFIKACLGGRRNINAEVVTPTNTNFIKYKTKAICFHGFLSSEWVSNDFQSFCKLFPFVTSGGWRLLPPPEPVFIKREDASDRVKHINACVEIFKNEFNILDSFTIGEACISMLVKQLNKFQFLERQQIIPAARRLLFEDAKFLGKKDFQSNESWKKFKALDDDRINFVGRCLIPIERLSQIIGSYALESYQFTISDANPELAVEHRDFVKRVRTSYNENRIDASPEIKARIGSALDRTDETLFTRNVEGIVFSWRGHRLKLTGAFGGINRIKGYFTYGSTPARFI